MASRNTASHRRSSRIFWLIFLMSGLMLVMVAGVAVAAAPYVAIESMGAPPTSRPIPWGPAHIAKPAYTPSPVPTATPPPTATETLPPATETAVVADIPPTSDAGLTMSYADTSLDGQSSSLLSPGGKYILVSISEQHLSAYENGQEVYSFVASTGMRNSTRVGTFSVLDKIPNAYGSTWNIWMPNWMGIYYSGTLENGIHALPILPSGDQLWAGFLGQPISFGCVVLGANEAIQLYDWADIGTPVEIQW